MSAMEFEDMLRNNPGRTNQMLNQFQNQKAGLNDSSILSNHAHNLEAIKQADLNSNNRVHNEAPNNFSQGIKHELAESTASKDRVMENMRNSDRSLSAQGASLQTRGNKLQKNVDKKTSESVPERLVDAWLHQNDELK